MQLALFFVLLVGRLGLAAPMNPNPDSTPDRVMMGPDVLDNYPLPVRQQLHRLKARYIQKSMKASQARKDMEMAGERREINRSNWRSWLVYLRRQQLDLHAEHAALDDRTSRLEPTRAILNQHEKHWHESTRTEAEAGAIFDYALKVQRQAEQSMLQEYRRYGLWPQFTSAELSVMGKPYRLLQLPQDPASDPQYALRPNSAERLASEPRGVPLDRGETSSRRPNFFRPTDDVNHEGSDAELHSGTGPPVDVQPGPRDAAPPRGPSFFHRPDSAPSSSGAEYSGIGPPDNVRPAARNAERTDTGEHMVEHYGSGADSPHLPGLPSEEALAGNLRAARIFSPRVR